MDVKILRVFLIFFFISIIPYCTKAQYLWHLVHTDFDGNNYYEFNAISCVGDNCTVTGRIVDTVTHQVSRMFWRSNDGGLTWKKQDPHLPSSQSLGVTHNYFSTIQQIDSLNIIAAGDSGYIVRTHDAGNTWIKLDFKSVGVFIDLHFSDSLIGIALVQESYGFVAQGPIVIYTTLDGGKNWKSVALSEFNPQVRGDFISCHSYGHGKFRVFKWPVGPVYTTYDNWETIDSSQPIFDIKDTSYKWYTFSHCNFSTGDTIISYGEYIPNGSFTDKQGLLVRSTDAGISWEKPVTFTQSISNIAIISSLDRDTVLGLGSSANKILISTNRGKSWRVDSLFLDTIYSAYWPKGFIWTGEGNPVAIYTYADFINTPSIIIRGEQKPSHVESGDFVIYKALLYPNPASDILNIDPAQHSGFIRIIDIFGRDVIKPAISIGNTLAIDISTISRGIYNVLIEDSGRLLVIGKLAIIGK